MTLVSEEKPRRRLLVCSKEIFVVGSHGALRKNARTIVIVYFDASNEVSAIVMLDEAHLIRARSFRILASSSGIDHGLFRLEFGKDGSFYVPFPYFNGNQGIAAELTLQPNKISQDVDAGDHGRVTSNRVKFSYHSNGRVHFSLTRKVRSDIGRMSVPLSENMGHIFSVYIQCFNEFKGSSAQSDAHNLRFIIDPTIAALKVVCFRFPLSRIGFDKPGVGQHLRGHFRFTDGEGKIRSGLFVSPLVNYVHSDWGFALITEQIPILNVERSPLLLFIGGFDPVRVSLDHSQPMSLLALSYPCTQFTDLKKRLGSIDIFPQMES